MSQVQDNLPTESLDHNDHVRVDLAQACDMDELITLRPAYLAEDIGRIEDTRYMDNLRRYLEDHLGRDLTVCVARDERIVGCAWLLEVEKPPSPHFPTGKTATVLNVYVFPDRRGQGIGTALLRRLADEARARGIEQVSLLATQAGADLYRRTGFVERDYLPMALRP
jgi:ribosomal protein S18 acetylase RimI-like enzyme